MTEKKQVSKPAPTIVVPSQVSEVDAAKNKRKNVESDTDVKNDAKPKKKVNKEKAKVKKGEKDK